MPVLAGLHEAFTAVGHHVEQQQGSDWFSTFCGEAAVRLPISLVLAFAIFALVSAAGDFCCGSVVPPSRHKRRDIPSI
jgi:hypothetical protein